MGLKLENAVVMSNKTLEDYYDLSNACERDCPCDEKDIEYEDYLAVMLGMDGDITTLQTSLDDLYLELCNVDPNCFFHEVQYLGSDMYFVDNIHNQKTLSYPMNDDLQQCMKDKHPDAKQYSPPVVEAPAPAPGIDMDTYWRAQFEYSADGGDLKFHDWGLTCGSRNADVRDNDSWWVSFNHDDAYMGKWDVIEVSPEVYEIKYIINQ